MRQEPDKAEARGLDVDMLTRIIEQRVTAVTEQFRHGPKSKIEDLLNLDKAHTEGLWRLDFESVRNLKGLYPLTQVVPATLLLI